MERPGTQHDHLQRSPCSPACLPRCSWRLGAGWYGAMSPSFSNHLRLRNLNLRNNGGRVVAECLFTRCLAVLWLYAFPHVALKEMTMAVAGVVTSVFARFVSSWRCGLPVRASLCWRCGLSLRAWLRLAAVAVAFAQPGTAYRAVGLGCVTVQLGRLFRPGNLCVHKSRRFSYMMAATCSMYLAHMRAPGVHTSLCPGIYAGVPIWLCPVP